MPYSRMVSWQTAQWWNQNKSFGEYADVIPFQKAVMILCLDKQRIKYEENTLKWVNNVSS